MEPYRWGRLGVGVGGEGNQLDGLLFHFAGSASLAPIASFGCGGVEKRNFGQLKHQT